MVIVRKAARGSSRPGPCPDSDTLARLDARIKATPVEIVATSTLKRNPRNAKRHSDKKVATLAENFKHFGFTQPLVVDENNVILVEHARCDAARLINLPNVPVFRIPGLSANEKAALALADNKLHECGSHWDFDILSADLKVLFDPAADLTFDPRIIGFDTAEVDHLLLDGLAKADPADNIPIGSSADPPVTRVGDTWVFCKGKLTHKLQCGDARFYEAYTSVLGDELADVVIAAPLQSVAGDQISMPELIELLRAFVVATKRCVRVGAVFYMFMDWAHLPALWEAANPEFGPPKNLIVWVKSKAGKASIYRQQHEMISVYVHGDHAAINNFKVRQNGRFRSDVWQYPGSDGFGPARDEALAGHRLALPVALVADALRDCSSRGGLVLDPFGGSGTTLIAAQKTGRQARLIEFDPLYCDVIVRRWQNFTRESA